jgi:hypothetical protein
MRAGLVRNARNNRTLRRFIEELFEAHFALLISVFYSISFRSPLI